MFQTRLVKRKVAHIMFLEWKNRYVYMVHIKSETNEMVNLLQRMSEKDTIHRSKTYMNEQVNNAGGKFPANDGPANTVLLQ